MASYVALLGDVNLDADRRITMTALRELLEGLGYENVQTFEQRGNAVFTTTLFPNGDIARNITSAIRRDLEMDVDVIIRTDEELREIVAGNPFPEREEEPETLRVAFLAATPDPEEVAALAVLPRGDDDYRVIGDNVYLSYPNGASGAVFQPTLSVPQTSRNWSTVTQLADIASTAEGDVSV